MCENDDIFVPTSPLLEGEESEKTSFQEIYDLFFSVCTDDMFLEMTREDCENQLENLLMASITMFEFPRWSDPFDLDLKKKEFTALLTLEEKLIIRDYMVISWLGMQLTNIDLVRQKYTSADWKLSSQASHMKQLVTLKKEYETRAFHAQRVYTRRRKNKEGVYVSTFRDIMKVDDKNV